jgi:two-component system LytT family response regulator
MTVTAVIIDDEQNNIDNLEILLQQHCPQVEITGRATNATEGEKIITDQNPDIVFLDIQMPGRNGFDMLQSLKHHSFELIFVTAFDQYGIQAVKFSAIDYLLKPINTDELKLAVNKAIYRSNEKKQNKKLENLLELITNRQQKDLHRIALTSARETRFIKTDEIIRCESSNNYTTFFIEDGEKIMTSKPIFEYEEILAGYGFIRCHQTHLVNRKFIRSLIKGDGGYLLLTDGTEIPVSRMKKEELKKELGL